ncbi:MAG: dihydrodipicolinate reductase [Opitutaceae bacterium]|nr:dihydrodipicolinate reductase [Cytophagales bacterium]
MKIFIVGSGKLATAILSDLVLPNCEIVKWENKTIDSVEKSILIHAGSGRQLQECVEFCHNTKSVFIELSTGLETENLNPDFPLIICPNTSLLLLKTMNMIKENGIQFKDYQVSITESHQSSKSSVPGTAISFAQSLILPAGKINSVREKEFQLNNLRIPQEYLDKHAYHKIVIQDGLDEVVIETKILGHTSYIKGVRKIIEAILNNQLDNRRYSVLELIKQEVV